MLLADLSNVNRITAGGFAVMRAAGVAGVWLKETEGLTYDDSQARLREQLAEYADLHVGAYHYARPDHNSPADEANHFLRRYTPAHNDSRALRVALDLEETAAAPLGRRLIEWARDWNRRVHAELGHWPLFYSNPGYITFAMGMRASDPPVGGGLWLSLFGRNDGREHPYTIPPPWSHLLAHQFTSRGRLPGVAGDVDLTFARALAPLLAHPSQDPPFGG